MTKEKLIEILEKLLQTDADLSFLTVIAERDLEKLIACIRDRVEFKK